MKAIIDMIKSEDVKVGDNIIFSGSILKIKEIGDTMFTTYPIKMQEDIPDFNHIPKNFSYYYKVIDFGEEITDWRKLL